MRKTFILMLVIASLLLTSCHGVRPGAGEEAVLVYKPWFFGAEKKQLVKWRWKPKEKETYWCICPDGQLSSGIFSNDEFDNGAYNFCNCFRTREEAEAMAEKIRKLLKGE